ncbi:hypothetical protein DL96DRAFT_1809756 [Flagelloscypha sp. PMI_526]|nr:hypothetical protein DL96DRAFT_1809756 [Flagelloscypha sp. PMI_526]
MVNPNDPFPPELWFIIAQYLTKEETWSLRALNRTFLNLAWDYRYEKLILTTQYLEPWSKPFELSPSSVNYIYRMPVPQSRCKHVVLAPHVELMQSKQLLNIHLGFLVRIFQLLASLWFLCVVPLQLSKTFRGLTSVTSLEISTLFYFPTESHELIVPEQALKSCWYLNTIWQTRANFLVRLSLCVRDFNDLSRVVLPYPVEASVVCPALEWLKLSISDGIPQAKQTLLDDAITKLRLLYHRSKRLKHFELHDGTRHPSQLSLLLPDDPQRYPLLQSFKLTGLYFPGERQTLASFFQLFQHQLKKVSMDYLNNISSPVVEELTHLELHYAWMKSGRDVLSVLSRVGHNLQRLQVCCGASIDATALPEALSGAVQLRFLVVEKRQLPGNFFTKLAAHVPTLKHVTVQIDDLVLRVASEDSYFNAAALARKNEPGSVGSLEPLLTFFASLFAKPKFLLRVLEIHAIGQWVPRGFQSRDPDYGVIYSRGGVGELQHVPWKLPLSRRDLGMFDRPKERSI